MIRINRLLRLPHDYSHKFGEVESLERETVFANNASSKVKGTSKTKKEIRRTFKKLVLLKRHEMKNGWYTYNYDKVTNKISFITT